MTLHKARKYVKMLLYLFIIYRILNILVVQVWADINDVGDFNKKANGAIYTDFEYPAANLDQVIEYETLGWCHRCLISKDEFNNYTYYKNIERKISISFLFLPWKMPISLAPTNEDDRHQYNDDYDIAVWSGNNVVTGQAEEIIFYYGDFELIFVLFLFLVSISMTAEVIAFIIKKIKKYKML